MGLMVENKKVVYEPPLEIRAHKHEHVVQEEECIWRY